MSLWPTCCLAAVFKLRLEPHSVFPRYQKLTRGDLTEGCFASSLVKGEMARLISLFKWSSAGLETAIRTFFRAAQF